MQLTFLVNYDLPALLALNHILPSCALHEVAVFYTRKATVATAPLPLQNLSALDAKFLTQKSELLSFEDMGAIELNRINGIDFPAFAQTDPDLVVSIRHMSILRGPVIEVPRFGVINLHSGLLPTYQGVMSTFRAMCNGDAVIGTTLHRIEDVQIDAGAIIARSQTSTRFDKSYLWNVLNIYREGCLNVGAAIVAIDKGADLDSHPQEGSGNYFTYPSAQEIDAASFALFEHQDLHQVSQFFHQSL